MASRNFTGKCRLILIAFKFYVYVDVGDVCWRRFMLMTTLQYLKVTLRHFYTPYNTTWPFYGQTLWIHAYTTCNTKSFILWWFFISQKSHPDEEKFQFPAHFRLTKFLKFYFRFSYISSKDAELNFRGSPWGDFLDPTVYYTPKVDFRRFLNDQSTI